MVYIDGAWVAPQGGTSHAVINPATEEPVARIALGTAADVDLAVAAARRAFPAFAGSSRADRIALLRRVADVFATRREEMARILTMEMGGPLKRTLGYQTAAGQTHLDEIVRVLETYRFEERRGRTVIRREPIGVCGLITPWNAPVMQILTKVAPALAAGCTMVLKPSELAPFSAMLFTEILHEAGVPKGVFNLVNGDGPTVGEALARHPDVDMISFTGSTRAGVRVAEAAAPTVKRVHQELGGKAANILLPDSDLEEAVVRGVQSCFGNSGQSCIAPARLLVPKDQANRAAAIAAAAAETLRVGDPMDPATDLGPLVSRAQFDRVQELIAAGIAEGATLVAGGLGRPDGLTRGYFARPTVFADVVPGMLIEREEIFGPVVTIIAYDSVEQAIAIANDTPYGLAAYVQSRDPSRAEAVAARLRCGYVYLNGAGPDYSAPFGGWKQSGNGREYGEWGLDAFLELKTVVGAAPG
ncbi:aldehyde dehydrogenase family protein [Azospirillum rugosum]|nr:aldehyde dehydrogenase family protein [Azospirillum rugosum]